MIFPKEVKILGFVWKIEFSKVVAYEGNCNGSTHIDTQIIYLNPDATEQKLQETFLHELMHALIVSNGMDRLFEQTDYKLSQEDIVRTLSVGLYHILKDNNIVFGESSEDKPIDGK